MSEIEGWLFDAVVQFLRSPLWIKPLQGFIDKYCLIFTGEEENKFAHTRVHNDFRNLIENILETHLQNLGVTPEQFVEVCEKGRNKHKLLDVVFKYILVLDDFLKFKQMMVKRNQELEEESIKNLKEMLRNRQVNTPQTESTPVKAKKKKKKKSKDEEKLLLEKVMKESKMEAEKAHEAQMIEEENLKRAIEMSLQFQREIYHNVKESAVSQNVEKAMKEMPVVTKKKELKPLGKNNGEKKRLEKKAAKATVVKKKKRGTAAAKKRRKKKEAADAKKNAAELEKLRKEAERLKKLEKEAERLKMIEKESERVKREKEEELQRLKKESEQAIEILKKAKDEQRQALLDKLSQAEEQFEKVTEKFHTTASELQKTEEQRRKLHNVVEDSKGKIRVYCRCRPISKSERQKNAKEIVTFLSKSSLNLRDDKRTKTIGFEYNRVFDIESTQTEVYADTKDMIQSAVDGYNTGSGKTYTIAGEKGAKGIVPRAIADIFAIQKKRKLYDLYAKEKSKKKLVIKKNVQGHVEVTHVVTKEAKNSKQLLKQYTDAMKNRHVRSTAMNIQSSRSHLIKIIGKNKRNGSVSYGKVSLVDLAGSERQKKSGVEKIALREASKINSSISALGNVINALSTKKKFVPYRDDPLTMLLSDSIGGTAKALMFVCISPVDYNCDETINSLNFAARAKTIVNKPVKVQDRKQTRILRQMNDALRKELEQRVSEEELEMILEKVAAVSKKKKKKKEPK